MENYLRLKPVRSENEGNTNNIDKKLWNAIYVD